MKTFKVIIAGGRDYDNFFDVMSYADYYLQARQDELEIVSGGAKGADALGERYAKVKGIKLKIFPADWDTHGKKAGFMRNLEMANYADALIAFWDGESVGTKMMIKLAKQKGLKVKVVRYVNKLRNCHR